MGKEKQTEMEDWSASSISALKRAAQRYPRSMDKNERWRCIADDIGRGKRECYERYKELKGAAKEKKKATPVQYDKHRVDENESDAAAVVDVGRQQRARVAESEEEEWSESKYDSRVNNNVEEGRRSGKNLSSTQVQQKLSREAQSPCLHMEEIEEDFGFDNDARDLSRTHQPYSNHGKDHIRGAAHIAQEDSESDECELDGETRMISLDQVKEIKALLFGAHKPPAFDSSWQKQGFAFSKVRDLQYGLIQLKGGPCGVMAVVQAFVLRELLFSDHPAADWTNPTRTEQRQALARALSELIWQSATASKRGRAKAYMCVFAGSSASGPASYAAPNYRPDRFMDKMQVIGPLASPSKVFQVVRKNLDSFVAKSGPGVGMLVMSLMLSRGLGALRADIDMALGPQSTLIGSHNYASQELVNLVLVGYACSNVFDGTQSLGNDMAGESKSSQKDADCEDMLLRGVQSRGQVGLLTLFEHYEYLTVGEHLKTPHHPIWVICSESHYSVVFAASQACMQEDNFDLYYYDELGNQDEQYRLTLDTCPACPVEHDTSDNRLVSPIEECIRTRWPGATVDWNGSDPLL